MLHDEFPHIVQLKSFTSESDGGGGQTTPEWSTVATFKAFMNTPSSREIYQAQQLQSPLDRIMYTPYRTDITQEMRVVWRGDQYELTGKPMDLGGLQEMVKVPLKLVRAGG